MLGWSSPYQPNNFRCNTPNGIHNLKTDLSRPHAERSEKVLDDLLGLRLDLLTDPFNRVPRFSEKPRDRSFQGLAYSPNTWQWIWDGTIPSGGQGTTVFVGLFSFPKFFDLFCFCKDLLLYLLFGLSCLGFGFLWSDCFRAWPGGFLCFFCTFALDCGPFGTLRFGTLRFGGQKSWKILSPRRKGRKPTRQLMQARGVWGLTEYSSIFLVF